MADWERARQSPEGFAAELGQYPLAPFQAAVTLGKFVTAIVASRQLGKSYLLAIIALWSAFRNAGQHVLLMSASEEGGRRLLETVRGVIASSDDLRASIVEEHGGILRTTTGSVIRVLATSEASARGWSADLLLLDEAQLLSESIVSALLPTTAAREGARVVMAGSASVASGPFFDHHRMGETGSEHVEAVRWVARVAGGDDDAPWIQPSFVEAQRASMSATRFAAEWKAEFQSGQDAAFTRAWIDRVAADFVPLAPADLRPRARGLAGLDWGMSNDMSTMVVLYRIAGTDLFAVACAHRWAPGTPIPEVVTEIARSPGHFHAVVAESVGMGGPACQMLWPALTERPYAAGGGLRRRFLLVDDSHGGAPARDPRRPRPRGFVINKVEAHTDASMKSVMFSAIRLLGEQGRLVIAASQRDLISELLMLRVALVEGGGERIAARTGHDDLALGLAFATYPFRRRGEREWRTGLAEYARRAPRLPVTPPPGVATLPTVTTATGVEIPRTPCWQSVAGTEITPPPGVDLPDDPDSEAPRAEMVATTGRST